MKAGETFVWIDRYLDRAQAGPLWMRDERVAALVEQRILSEPGCELHAYVIMANHIHLLMTPLVNPPRVMQSIKGGSARLVNQLLGQTGSFWQRESYDHWVRNSEEFGRVQRYIENNPVAAGLVETPEMYRWSSAFSSNPCRPR